MAKYIRLLILPTALMLTSASAAAQSGGGKMELVPHAPPQVVPERGPSDTLDVQPQPVSVSEIRKLRPRYPKAGREQGRQGLVQVTFDVQPTGLVKNVRIHKTSGVPLLDSEALRMTRIMEKKVYWKPGMKNERAVEAPVTFPVVFMVD